MEEWGFTYLIEFRGNDFCYYSISSLQDEELIRNFYALSSAEITSVVKIVHDKDGNFGELIRLKNQMSDHFREPILQWLSADKREVKFSSFRKGILREIG